METELIFYIRNIQNHFQDPLKKDMYYKGHQIIATINIYLKF